MVYVFVALHIEIVIYGGVSMTLECTRAGRYAGICFTGYIADLRTTRMRSALEDALGLRCRMLSSPKSVGRSLGSRPTAHHLLCSSACPAASVSHVTLIQVHCVSRISIPSTIIRQCRLRRSLTASFALPLYA